MDGTFVPIYSPHRNPEQFINRHAQFSLNCQICVNHRGVITHLSSRWPGSLHDVRIFQESYLQEVLDLGILGHRYLLGDSGYQLQSNLMIPYTQPDTDEKGLVSVTEIFGCNYVKLESLNVVRFH